MFGNPSQMILIGLAMLCTGFVLFRGSRRLRNSRTRNPQKESERDFLRAEQTVEARIQKLEVRLLEYEREVDAKINTKIKTLQQLILTAEKQIARLESLNGVEEKSGTGKTDRVVMIRQLQSAGFSETEIANMLQTDQREVKSALQSKDSGDSEAFDPNAA